MGVYYKRCKSIPLNLNVCFLKNSNPINKKRCIALSYLKNDSIFDFRMGQYVYTPKESDSGFLRNFNVINKEIIQILIRGEEKDERKYYNRRSE